MLDMRGRLRTEIQGGSSLGDLRLKIAIFKVKRNFLKLRMELKPSWDFRLRVGFELWIGHLKLRRGLQLRMDSLRLQVLLFELDWVLREWIGMSKMNS